MKKLVCLLAALMMLLLAVVPAMAAGGVVRYVKTGNGKSLNVREEPKTGDNVKYYIKYGTKVNVIWWVDSKWAYVEPEGYKNGGYVMTRYLVETKPGKYEPSKTKTDSDKAGDYSTFRHVSEYTMLVKPSTSNGFVNLRWAPSKTAASMERCHANQELIVIAEGNGWKQVRDPENGYTGFIYSSFLKQAR